MADIIIQNGDNFGTSKNDLFTTKEGVTNFMANAGDGFDTINADINHVNHRKIDWSTYFFENYIISGAVDGATTALSGSNLVYMSFGSHPKTVDTSAVTSSILLLSKAGTENTFIGGETTIVGFHSSVVSSAEKSTFDFSSGNAVLEIAGGDSTSFKANGNANYLLPNVQTNEVTGNDANNGIIVDSGSGVFVAGEGTDTVYFSTIGLGAEISDYNISKVADDKLIITATGFNGQTIINTTSVERITFLDGNDDIDRTLAFDLEGNAGQAYRLYQAVFDRAPDLEGLGYWIREMDEGKGDRAWVASNFMKSVEFKETYGTQETVSDDDFLNLLYQNVLDRSPDDVGLAYWKDELDRGFSREGVISSFSESIENKSNVAAQIDDGIWYI